MFKLSALRFQPLAHSIKLRELMADHPHLAGPLGFEPRQSAPKALDLPLVDGPVAYWLPTVAQEILRFAQDFGSWLRRQLTASTYH